MTPEIISTDSGWPYTKAKTAVLTAAAAVICEEGPRAATLKNIANRAGITEPAIFRHFDGVDGLFGGLFSAFERIYARFDQAYESEEKGLPRLRNAMLSIVDTLAASRDFAYILIHGEQVFRGYPELRKRIAELKKQDERNALECIAEGVASGDLRSDVDPGSIATSTLGMFYITAVMWIEKGFAFDLREVCDGRWDDIERLIATKQAARSADRPRLRSAALKVEADFPKETARSPKPSKAAAKPTAKKGAKPLAAKASKPSAKAPLPKAKAAPAKETSAKIAPARAAPAKAKATPQGKKK
jgi:AcrR family transcriptional regulator